MTTCCGKERDTNFCPDCGTQLREAAGPTLLAHLRYQAKRLASRKDKKNMDTAPKYERWAQWVQSQIADSEPEHQIKHAAEEFIERLKLMKEDERQQAIQIVLSAYCQYCGGDNGSGCQCINDE